MCCLTVHAEDRHEALTARKKGASCLNAWGVDLGSSFFAKSVCAEVAGNQGERAIANITLKKAAKLQLSCKALGCEVVRSLF